MYYDLVNQLAQEHETTAGFIAACRRNLDAVLVCLYKRGWKYDSIERFKSEVMSTPVDETPESGVIEAPKQENVNDV